jgi:hypothetical protein
MALGHGSGDAQGESWLVMQTPKKRRPNGTRRGKKRRSAARIERRAAIQLVQQLKRAGVSVKAIPVELSGQRFVVQVQYADVIPIDPFSEN